MSRIMIISIRKSHAEKIFVGLKSVEVRRTIPRCALPIRCLVWVPGVGIQGSVDIVYRIIAPHNVSNQVSVLLPLTGLSAEEFETYVVGARKVVLLGLANPARFPEPLPLLIRPPQTWRYLPADSEVLQCPPNPNP